MDFTAYLKNDIYFSEYLVEKQIEPTELYNRINSVLNNSINGYNCKIITCYNCDGSGSIENHFKTIEKCTICNGKGRLLEETVIQKNKLSEYYHNGYCIKPKEPYRIQNFNLRDT